MLKLALVSAQRGDARPQYGQAARHAGFIH
jgi:hypothetical protein